MFGKVLYIGMEIDGHAQTGGEYVQLQNRKMLRELFGEISIIEVPKISTLHHLKNLLLLKSYGHTKELAQRIEEESNYDYNFVFVEGSYYGRYVKFLRKRGQRIILFCHNVEYDFYKAKYASEKSLINLALAYYIRYNESLSIKYASKIIALNKRDSDGLLHYYRRSSDIILPPANPTIDKNELTTEYHEKYLLFVGANFYANVDGIIWFIENVSPQINIKVYVAGGCCNSINEKCQIANYPNVKLMGFVDNLDQLYKQSSGVICPIFAGSGMKTKTIEALRYGRSVFGTKEAFEGIIADFDKIGGLCNTADEFIQTINNSKNTGFNEYSYDFFVKNFSIDSVYPKFLSFLKFD